MKYTVLCLLIIIFCGTFAVQSCKKKTDSKHCWTCHDVDSVASNIPALVSVTAVDGVHCEYTDWMKDEWIRQHTYVDTLRYTHDSLQLRYHSSTCEIY